MCIRDRHSTVNIRRPREHRTVNPMRRHREKAHRESGHEDTGREDTWREYSEREDTRREDGELP